MSSLRAPHPFAALVLTVTLFLGGSTAGAQEAVRATWNSELSPGQVEIVLRNRTFVIPERVVSGLTIQPTFGFRWRTSEDAELALDAQTVDNSGPGRQGRFVASRTVPGGGSGNFLQELTLQASLRLLGASEDPWRLTLTASASHARRSYFALDTVTGQTFGGNRREVVPTVALEAANRGGRGRASLSLVSVFLSDNDALYLRRLPDDDEKFGTVVGPEGALDVHLAGPFSFRARAFVPFAGHNTIRRSTGRVARAVPYDAGLQLQLNPGLAAEAFVSNALGNTGALAFIPDREYTALGVGLRARPNAYWPVASAATPPLDAIEEQELAVRALAPLADGNITAGRVGSTVRWSGQGLLAAAELTPVPALTLGAFLDLLNGTRDEGELGVVGRVRLLGDRGDLPVHVGAMVAASRTNNPLVNLLAGRWDQLQRLGLHKGGFRPGNENIAEGRLYIVAGALPVTWRAGRVGGRLAPVIGYVQRNGVQIGGVAAGTDVRLSTSTMLSLESGVSMGKGNELTFTGRKRSVPFSAALSWTPDAHTYEIAGAVISFDAFVTNRAGDSPFHMLRVRAGGTPVVGIGMRVGM